MKKLEQRAELFQPWEGSAVLLDEELTVSLLPVPCVGDHSLQEELEADVLTAAFLLWLWWKDQNGCRNSSRCAEEVVWFLLLMGRLSLHKELGKSRGQGQI